MMKGIFIFLFSFIFFINCSSDGGGTEPETPSGNSDLPESMSVVKVTISQDLIDAANSGDEGAFQIRLALELLNSANDFYLMMLPPEFSPELQKSSALIPRTWKWREDNLEITLEYEDAGSEWYMNQYYSGSDYSGVQYDNFLRGHITKCNDIFSGTLKIYDIDSYGPVLNFEWGNDGEKGKRVYAYYEDYMTIYYWLNDSTNNNPVLHFSNAHFRWIVEFMSNGSGNWSKLDRTGKELSRGSW